MLPPFIEMLFNNYEMVVKCVPDPDELLDLLPYLPLTFCSGDFPAKEN